jgi:hypothetical protein
MASYIPWMTRLNLVRLAVAGTVLTLAFPLASYASGPGPLTPHPTTPADTLTKLEKSKSDRAAPTARKKLKARQAAPQTSTRPDFVPDQPWETEFYVDNDLPSHSSAQFALASFPRRP